MEQIKDMVTLRSFALDKAVATFYGVDINNNLGKRIIERAKDIEAYILGDAKLPEQDNSMEKYLHEMKDVLLNRQGSCSWISADNDIRPSGNIPVVIKLEDCQEYFIGQYTKEYGWTVPNAPYNRSIVAWLPIPPYVKEAEI